MNDYTSVHTCDTKLLTNFEATFNKVLTTRYLTPEHIENIFLKPPILLELLKFVEYSFILLSMLILGLAGRENPRWNQGDLLESTQVDRLSGTWRHPC